MENQININSWWQKAEPILVVFGLKILGSIIAFIIGRWLISILIKLFDKLIDQQKIDPTIKRYLDNIVSFALNVILFIVLLGYFGVETTSFAALLAGAGIAIGSAWGGLLSNFASGFFLIILRPFNVGDYVVAGGVEGTVVEIGLFGTGINTPENIRTIVGNAKILANDIKNFGINQYRRIELSVQLDASVDVVSALENFKQSIEKIDGVLKTPSMELDILPATEMGPVISLRPYAANANFGKVKFEVQIAVMDIIKKMRYPLPQRHILLTSVANELGKINSTI